MSKIFNDPWPHIIEEDFYDIEDFEYFKAIAIKIYNEIQPEQKIIKTQTLDVFKNKYEARALSYLELLAPEKIKLYNKFQLDIQGVGINETSQNFVHVDRDDKLLSIVAYGYPETHIGTFIGTKHNLQPLQWKQNRAVIFSRAENTWHKFSTMGLRPRVTFNINLYR